MVSNIMPIWKYIRTVCVKPISGISVILLSWRIFNLQFVLEQRDSGGKVFVHAFGLLCYKKDFQLAYFLYKLLYWSLLYQYTVLTNGRTKLVIVIFTSAGG